MEIRRLECKRSIMCQREQEEATAVYALVSRRERAGLVVALHKGMLGDENVRIIHSRVFLKAVVKVGVCLMREHGSKGVVLSGA